MSFFGIEIMLSDDQYHRGWGCFCILWGSESFFRFWAGAVLPVAILASRGNSGLCAFVSWWVFFVGGSLGVWRYSDANVLRSY